MHAVDNLRIRAEKWRNAGWVLVVLLGLFALVLGFVGSEACDLFGDTCERSFLRFLVITVVVFLGSLLPIIPLFGFASVIDGQADMLEEVGKSPSRPAPRSSRTNQPSSLAERQTPTTNPAIRDVQDIVADGCLKDVEVVTLSLMSPQVATNSVSALLDGRDGTPLAIDFTGSEGLPNHDRRILVNTVVQAVRRGAATRVTLHRVPPEVRVAAASAGSESGLLVDTPRLSCLSLEKPEDEESHETTADPLTARATATSEEAPAPNAYCGECGAPASEGASFCKKCGATTNPTSATPEPVQDRP